MRVLFISAYLPYAAVPHAGGRTHYHYVRRLAESAGFDVVVLGFIAPDEAENLALASEPYRAEVLVYPTGTFERIAHKIWRAWLRFAPHARHGGVVPPRQEAKLWAALSRIKAGGPAPDLVVLEWSQMALLAPQIRRMFPAARIVASLHDCLFQWAARTAAEARGMWARRVWAARAAYIREIELAALATVDLVLVQSVKDVGLLAAAGLPRERIHVIAPRFQLPEAVDARQPSHDIVYFGAMDRVENYSACHWFLDEVMPLLGSAVPSARFVIVGARPPDHLHRRAGPKVEVTGFVPDVAPYFQRALCLVAPLKLGAGIKVKVLEGMAAGLPVLTNDVGIEGIPARAGTDYLHCETAADYARAIADLVGGVVDGGAIGTRGRLLVRREFDLDESFRRLHTRMETLGASEPAP